MACLSEAPVDRNLAKRKRSLCRSRHNPSAPDQLEASHHRVRDRVRMGMIYNCSCTPTASNTVLQATVLATNGSLTLPSEPSFWTNGYASCPPSRRNNALRCSRNRCNGINRNNRRDLARTSTFKTEPNNQLYRTSYFKALSNFSDNEKLVI